MSLEQENAILKEENRRLKQLLASLNYTEDKTELDYRLCIRKLEEPSSFLEPIRLWSLSADAFSKVVGLLPFSVLLVMRASNRTVCLSVMLEMKRRIYARRPGVEYLQGLDVSRIENDHQPTRWSNPDGLPAQKILSTVFHLESADSVVFVAGGFDSSTTACLPSVEAYDIIDGCRSLHPGTRKIPDMQVRLTLLQIPAHI
jgi:hypothetical protein